MKCPICKKGELPPPYRFRKFDAKMKKEMAHVLLKAGYSYRQTAQFLNYKSHSSLQV